MAWMRSANPTRGTSTMSPTTPRGKDQDLFISAGIDNQTTAILHNSARYGATRKREQNHDWTPEGSASPWAHAEAQARRRPSPAETISVCPSPFKAPTATARSDRLFSIAAGRTAQATQLIPNSSRTATGSSITATSPSRRTCPALPAFNMRDERGAEPGSTYYTPVERTNYFFPLGRARRLQAALLLYARRQPGALLPLRFPDLAARRPHLLLASSAQRRSSAARASSSTSARRSANPSSPIRTIRSITFSKLHNVVVSCRPIHVQSLHISPLAAPTMRTYEGGIGADIPQQPHHLSRASYFHNEFGKEIEYVGLDLVPALLPNLTPAQQAALEAILQANFAYELTINSEAFRAQGVETSVESGIGRNLFLRGGYTYLDAVVQRSFTNDDQALLGPIPTFNGIPVGPYAPLEGARPFRRAPTYRLFHSHVCRQAFYRRLHVPPFPAARTTRPILRERMLSAAIVCFCPTAISITATPNSIWAEVSRCCPGWTCSLRPITC